MNIRYAKEKDLYYIIKWGHVKDKKIIRKKIKNKEFIVAEDKDLIGFLMFQNIWEIIPYIEMIHVEKRFRKKGIARKMLEMLEKNTKAKVIISSCVCNEKEPQAWHKKLGFEKKGYIDGIQPEGREVFFVKKLNK